MGKTKKVGAAGKYGARYGVRIRKKLLDLEKAKKVKNLCPNCRKDNIKRVAAGIWTCKKCGLKMAGGAHKL